MGPPVPGWQRVDSLPVRGLRGPARVITIVGMALGVLWIITLTIALTRYESALSTYSRADRLALVSRAQTSFRNNLIDRVQAIERGLDGDSVQSDLRNLDGEFATAERQARTAGPTADAAAS